MIEENRHYPRTVDEAVDRLLSTLPLRVRVKIAKLPENEVIGLHFSLGLQIRDEFGLRNGNESLMESCRTLWGQNDLHVDYACVLILKSLWKTLQKTHLLRLTK